LIYDLWACFPVNFLIQYFIPFILILSVLVFVHEWGHFWVARRNGVRVTDFSIGFGPELFGWTDSKKTRWKMCIIPLGGYVKMLGDADATSVRSNDTSISQLTAEEKNQTLHSKTPLQRIAVAAAGPAANYIFAFVLLLLLILFKGLPFYPAKIGHVDPKMAAAQHGIQEGDVIQRVNGTPVDDFDSLRHSIQENVGKTIRLTIGRGAEVIEKDVQLFETDPTTQEVKPITRLGLGPWAPEYRLVSFFTAVKASVAVCWNMSVSSLQGIWAMITRQKGAGELGGILSIGDMAGQSTKGGTASLVWFMAILSINLGLINLLPIPVLDGGHIVLCSIEAVRGKPVPPKMQEYIFLAGFLVVASIMLFATWSDLMRYKIFETIQGWFF
jgi:regulator of sigma E protease